IKSEGFYSLIIYDFSGRLLQQVHSIRGTDRKVLNSLGNKSLVLLLQDARGKNLCSKVIWNGL
ncbi:MAG: hypothetical protein AAFO69_17410, partial [Bacteroidota bacterium]